MIGSSSKTKTVLDPAPISKRPPLISNPAFCYRLAVLLLPVLVLWHRRDALFSPLWYTDPWFYLGHFRNLANYKRDLFFGSYYGSRLAWLLPGFLVHAVLSPVIANLVLHLTVHLTATLSFFAILRRLAGARSAFVATMIFSADPWLWAATGWDYVDGAGIAYCLLAMALLSRFAAQPTGKWVLVTAGIATAGMAYSHIFLGTLVPLVLFYYFGLVSAGSGQFHPRLLLGSCLWIGAGFVTATLALCGINYGLDGIFWFYAPSLNRASFMAKDFRFVRSVWRPQELVPWLWPAIFGLLTAIALFRSQWKSRTISRNRGGMLFGAMLLLAFLYLVYLQIRGNTILAFHPYVSYLLPFAFLVMGVSFWPAVGGMSTRAYVLTCCAGALLLGALWYYPSGYHGLTSAVASQAAIAVSACFLAVALVFRQHTIGTILGLAGFVVFTAAALSGTYLAEGRSLHSTWDQYVRVMNARKRIEDRRGGAPISFWYDRQEPLYLEHFALNSTYMAEFSRINETFPNGCSQPSEPGTLIVVVSQKAQSTQIAERTLTDCWRQFGVHPVVDDVEAVRDSGPPYTMTMLKVVPDTQSISPTGELFKSFAIEQVQAGAPGVALQRVPAGIEVDTVPGLGAFAARVKLGLDPSLSERLEAVVRLRVLEGKIVAGVQDLRNINYLISYPVWPLPRAIDVVLRLPSPIMAGDLLICNARQDRGISKFIIEKVEVRKLP
jgi:hypothetical protein